MRYVSTFMCVLALGLMGCSETSGTGGGGGDAGVGGDVGNGGVGGGGDGGTGGMTGQEFPCTEQGIRDAIAEGGGPHTFGPCEAPPTLTETVGIDNDVILDGEGTLVIDASDLQGVPAVIVFDDTTAELRGLMVTTDPDCPKACSAVYVDSRATLTLIQTAVSSSVDGIGAFGSLSVVESTVSADGTAIGASGSVVLTNSTVSGNYAAIADAGSLTFVNSTVRGGVVGNPDEGQALTTTGSIIAGACVDMLVTSNGYNIESPGNTCGFDATGDRVNVSADDLKLGELADNGGPTMTHALGEGSVAIDQIPAEDCVDPDDQPLTTDQRGVPRDERCDVGAFEVNPCTGLGELSPCGEGFPGTCYAGICLPDGSDGCAEVDEGAKCFGFHYRPDYNKDVYVGFCVAGSCVPACLVLDDGAECTDPYFSGVGVCREGRCSPSG